METYSHIVVLGKRCATTHNVRRFFNFGEGYPFDWWITPFDGLLQVLKRPDVDWLYDPALIRLTVERRSVRHTPTRIFFHHEFPREPEASPQAGRGPPVRADFLEHLEAPRARAAALLKKLLSLDTPGARILFVRENGDQEVLEAALAERFSKADWTLKVVPMVISPGFIPPCPKERWKGDPAAWDRALSVLDVRLDNPSLKPFTDVPITAQLEMSSAD